MPERYSLAFHIIIRSFLLTKNEKPSAVCSGSTDLILSLSRLDQHLLRSNSVNTVYIGMYVFRIIPNVYKGNCDCNIGCRYATGMD